MRNGVYLVAELVEHLLNFEGEERREGGRREEGSEGERERVREVEGRE